MPRHLRPLFLAATLAGSAWFAAATSAQSAPAPPTPEQAAPDGPPQLALSAPSPSWDAATAAGTSAGATDVAIPAVPPVGSGWTFAVAPYLWMASVRSAISYSPTRVNRSINARVDESFSDVFKQLNFAIMAGAEARRGPFSLQADAIYIDLLQDHSGVRSVTGPFGLVEVPVNLGGKLKLKTTIGSLTGGYDIFRNDRGFVQLFGGFRYLGLRSTLDWNFQGPLGNLDRAGVAKSDADIWNGIAGLRGEHALGDGPWKAIYSVDVGAGGSKLTWQGLAEVAYVRRWGDVGLGWRYLDFEQSGQKSTANLRMSGPIISLRYRFGG